MRITRRDAMVGFALAAMTGVNGWGSGCSCCREQPSATGILGPTVFNWDDMKPKKTANGEVRSLCKHPRPPSISWRCTSPC